MPDTLDRFRLYDSAGTLALVDRMARQALFRLDGRACTLIGVLRRGAPIADLLAERMQALAPGLPLTRMDLKVKRYSDDLHLLHPDTRLDASAEQLGTRFDGQTAIVVDDVLYQGYSLFRVLQFLRERSSDQVLTAVLVDRCAQRLPIRADIVGATLQIAPNQVIECNVPPFESELAIDVWHPPAAA